MENSEVKDALVFGAVGEDLAAIAISLVEVPLAGILGDAVGVDLNAVAVSQLL